MPLTHILVDFENTQPSAADVALLRGRDQRLWIFRGPGQKKYDAEFAEALMSLGERVGVVKCEKSGRNALDMHIALHIGRLLGALAEPAGATPAVSFIVVSRDTDYDPLLQYVRAQGYAATRVMSVRAALGGEPAEKPAAAKASRTRAAAPATAARTAAATPKTRTPAAKKSAKKAPAARAAKAPSKTASAKSATKAPPRSQPPKAAPPPKATPSLDNLVDEVVERWENPRNRPTRRDRMESWIGSHLRKKLPDGDVAPVVEALEKRGIVAFTDNRVEYPPWS